MGELYDELARLDRAIADRWKTRTKENAKYKLTATDIEFIIGPTLERVITEKQGEAIFKVVMAHEFTDSGFSKFLALVETAAEERRLNLKSRSGPALGPILNTLSMAVISRITFKSPGTNINYTAMDYLTVAELIRNHEITAFQAKIGGLQNLMNPQAAYHSTRDYLYTFLEDDPKKQATSIVHEATHAIQDWPILTL